MVPIIFARKAPLFHFLMLTLLTSVANCLMASVMELPNCRPFRVPQTAAHKLFNCLSNFLPRNSPAPHYQRLTPGCRSTTRNSPSSGKQPWARAPHTKLQWPSFPSRSSRSRWPQEPTTCVTLNCFAFFSFDFGVLFFFVFILFYFILELWEGVGESGFCFLNSKQ